MFKKGRLGCHKGLRVTRFEGKLFWKSFKGALKEQDKTGWTKTYSTLDSWRSVAKFVRRAAERIYSD